MTAHAALIAFIVGLAYGIFVGWCAGRVLR